MFLSEVQILTVHAYYGSTGCGVFKQGYTKSDRFLHKNQHTQRKLLNFEYWTNGESQQLAKIRGFKVDYFYFSCIKLEKLA